MSGDGTLGRAWREARRRRLLSTLAGYPVAAWFVIESVPNMLHYLGVGAVATEKVGSAITIVAIAVYPLALLLTWIFQVVPQSAITQGDVEELPPTRTKRLLIAFAVVLVSAGCVTFATMMWTPLTAEKPAPWWETRAVDAEAIAFLPPRLLIGDEETLRAAECVVYRIRDRLAGVPNLAVRGPAETEWLAVADVPLDSLARRLGVGTLITSTVEGFGDEMRLAFRVVDPSGRQRESISHSGPSPSANENFEEMAEFLEVEIREALGRIRGAPITTDSRRQPDAQHAFDQTDEEWALYQRHLAQRDVNGALAALERMEARSAEAADLDPSWPQPLVRRARVWAERAVLILTNDRPAAVAALGKTTAYADSALRRDPGNAEALRLRGLAALQYVAFTGPDASERTALLERADADLRLSQSRHRNRAEVRYLLAQVKQEQGQLSEALAIAQDAYDHDPYFALSQRVLVQLFDLSFHLSLDADARAWCDEGRRRFPGEWSFAACRLTLMGWGGLPPDLTEAGDLREEALANYPTPFRAALRPQLEALVAAVRAQDGDEAGARRSLASISAGAPPAVALTAAGVWLLLEDSDQALEQLRRYLAAAPGRRFHLATNRMLAPLVDDPRFLALLQTTPAG